MELKKAKQVLWTFRVAFIAGLVFALISIGSTVAGGVLKNNAYTQWTTVSPATDLQVRKDYYLRAICLDPKASEAYILLLDTYNQDGSFTKEESEEFLGIYNSNHTKLSKRDPTFAKLHYTVGFLYINGFDGTSATRIRMALPFLETASEHIPEDDLNQFAVSCYCKIGSFYRDYIWDAAASTREVNPTQMESLLEQIEETLQIFPDDTSPDAMCNYLGFCTAVCNLLLDQRDILAALAPRETVERILNTVYSTLPTVQQLQKEQTQTMLLTLQNNEDTYRQMIGRAFERTGS